jgi:hypothetical protein
MLQIGSGRLFQGEPQRSNALRGVLHTNLRLYGDRRIETAGGTLIGTNTLSDSSAVIYEMTEQMEDGREAPGILISRGMDPYQQEFAAITAFGLNVTCTPYADLLQRLTGDGPPGQTRPSQFVRQVFDKQVTCREEDEASLIAFMNDILRLERQHYRAAVRAIRTYVTGLQRLGDDLELAYTLLVASIESLAQEFDGHRAVWPDYDEAKRRPIDKALAGADDTTAENVRNALLEIEHVSLRRRFRDFTLAHLEPDYFREDARAQQGPVARADLPEALQEAYRLRSRYVHNLEALPRLLTFTPSHHETMRIERMTTLTFQGLSRLARHVIMTFVARGPKLDREPHNYSLEQSGVVQVPMSPEYWVAAVQGLGPKAGRGRLEGFLEQLSGLYAKTGSSLTDVRPMLAWIEEMLPSLTVADRRPFIALYLLFNRVAPADSRMPNRQDIWDRFGQELNPPSAESLFTHLVFEVVPDWPLPDHERALADYFRRRARKGGLRGPRLLETALILILAERHRLAGDLPRARHFISAAADNLPGHPGLCALEADFDGEQPVEWEKLLLPPAPDEQEAPAGVNGTP